MHEYYSYDKFIKSVYDYKKTIIKNMSIENEVKKIPTEELIKCRNYITGDIKIEEKVKYSNAHDNMKKL